VPGSILMRVLWLVYAVRGVSIDISRDESFAFLHPNRQRTED
jgi:hypothetical protein